MQLVKINRFSLQKAVNKGVYWTQHGQFLQVYIYRPELKKHVIFPVGDKTTFSQLLSSNIASSREISLPEGINADTTIQQFLLDSTQPKAVEFIINHEKHFLRNQACDDDGNFIEEITKADSTIYGDLFKHIQNNHIESYAEISDYLNKYYMKLEVEFFVKSQNWKIHDRLTNQMRDSILNYLTHKHEESSQQQLFDIKLASQQIERKIDNTLKLIQDIKYQADVVIKMYKNAAILVTTLHLTTFSYMIFFVDWLGWDIIEPVTYTVTIGYSILGYRFYKKHKIDRNQNNLTEKLRLIVLKPYQLVALKELEIRLESQRAELKRNQQKHRIASNRLYFRTCLVDQLI